MSASAALPHVPPGRAGVLWLRHRLQVARRGSEVLRHKLTMLATQRQQLLERAEATRREWTAADRAARSRLSRAAILDGDDAFAAAAAVPAMSVEVRWTTTMGVRYPEPPQVRPPARPAHPVPGGSALWQAAVAYRAAATTAAAHAAAAQALATVEEEITTTRRRVRALEKSWLPRLEQALSTARLQMAELETADAVRRLRARTANDSSAS